MKELSSPRRRGSTLCTEVIHRGIDSCLRGNDMKTDRSFRLMAQLVGIVGPWAQPTIDELQLILLKSLMLRKADSLHVLNFAHHRCVF